MSNGFLQTSNFDTLSDQQQGMPNRFMAYPTNYLIEEQNRISLLSKRMVLSQAAAVAEAIQARQQAGGLGRRPNHNSAATTHKNPNPSSARRSSDYIVQMLYVHVHPESRIHKPQLQNMYNMNNNYHHPDSAAVYRSQNRNHQSQNQSGYDDVAALRKYAQARARARAHYQFAMLQRKREHAFRLLVCSRAPPSSTYSTMLMNAQPATALTIGLSGGNLYQQQEQEIGNDNSNSVVQHPNNPTSTLTLRETNVDDGADQEDELDLSLRL